MGISQKSKRKKEQYQINQQQQREEERQNKLIRYFNEMRKKTIFLIFFSIE